ncbi:MAG: hypothetical protein ACP5M4_08215 [Acidobacteriaceae bacterium]
MRARATKSTNELGLMTATERKEVEAFRKAARKVTRQATRSRESAIQFLIEAGIFGEDGEPKEYFR